MAYLLSALIFCAAVFLTEGAVQMSSDTDVISHDTESVTFTCQVDPGSNILQMRGPDAELVFYQGSTSTVLPGAIYGGNILDYDDNLDGNDYNLKLKTTGCDAGTYKCSASGTSAQTEDTVDISAVYMTIDDDPFNENKQKPADATGKVKCMGWWSTNVITVTLYKDGESVDSAAATVDASCTLGGFDVFKAEAEMDYDMSALAEGASFTFKCETAGTPTTAETSEYTLSVGDGNGNGGNGDNGGSENHGSAIQWSLLSFLCVLVAYLGGALRQ